MEKRIDRTVRMVEADCRITDEEFIDLLLNGISPFCSSERTAEKLIERYGSLAEITELPFSVLSEIEGVGEAGAMRLCALRQVPRLIAMRNIPESKRLVATTEQMADYIKPFYLNEHREVLYILLLNDKKFVTVLRKICEGDNEGVIFDSNTIVKEAIKYNARNVVLFHNHFISDYPSERDIVVTNRINHTLNNVNIHLLDHIIVCGGRCVSMNSSGYILPPDNNELKDWY